MLARAPPYIVHGKTRWTQCFRPMRDPYDILGVSKSANDAEIKKAYRALAKKFHPDTRGGDQTAVRRFQEINAAYDILGDKEKRAQYDRGEIDASGKPRFHPGAGGFRPGGFHGGPGAGDTREFHFTWDATDEGFRPEDLFADLFGGLGARGGRGRGAGMGPRRGQDFALAITVGLEEAAKGGTRRIDLPDGRQIDIRIPAGLKEGQQIRLKGQGAPGMRGGPAGDVLISVSVAPHPWFVRDGRDLRLDLPVTLKEAVLGAKIKVPTLSAPVAVTVPPRSSSGRVLRLRGKGLPATLGEPAGDLYVRLVIALPGEPDRELEEFARRWSNSYDPRAKFR